MTPPSPASPPAPDTPEKLVYSTKEVGRKLRLSPLTVRKYAAKLHGIVLGPGAAYRFPKDYIDKIISGEITLDIPGPNPKPGPRKGRKGKGLEPSPRARVTRID